MFRHSFVNLLTTVRITGRIQAEKFWISMSSLFNLIQTGQEREHDFLKIAGRKIYRRGFEKQKKGKGDAG